MKWIKTRVAFEADDPDSAAEIIAEAFNDLGLKGVIIETPEHDPGLDWAGDALPAPEQNAVTGFFPDDEKLGDNHAKLEKKLAGLKSGCRIKYRIHSSSIDEQDWAESWKDHFHTVQISERIVVKPTWRQYERKDREIIIELDPGMAFGTGTHPTTALCLRLLEKYIQQGCRMLDIGTGSGILLIAAEKLGASALCGIDCDPAAIAIAEQNLELNAVKQDQFELKTGNLVEMVSETYNMITANILTSTIISLIPEIPRIIAPGGIFIASGILAENEAAVTAALQESNFKVIEVMKEDDWIGIAAKKS